MTTEAPTSGVRSPVNDGRTLPPVSRCVPAMRNVLGRAPAPVAVVSRTGAAHASRAAHVTNRTSTKIPSAGTSKYVTTVAANPVIEPVMLPPCLSAGVVTIGPAAVVVVVGAAVVVVVGAAVVVVVGAAVVVVVGAAVVVVVVGAVVGSMPFA